MGNFKTCQYLNKAVVATFWATFGKNWATFYNQHLATLLIFLPLVVVLVVVRSCCVQRSSFSHLQRRSILLPFFLSDDSESVKARLLRSV